MKQIKLKSGNFALVDDDVYEELSKYTWIEHKSKSYRTSYAVRNVMENGKQKRIWMHRIINNTDDLLQTDHINNNGLDNRRENLRSVTASENCLNRRCNNNYSTGIKNISKRKIGNNEYYVYRITRKGSMVCQKYFKELSDAVEYSKSI